MNLTDGSSYYDGELAPPPRGSRVAAERDARMQRMRALVRENNVYRWGGSLIGECGWIRLAKSARKSPAPALDW